MVYLGAKSVLITLWYSSKAKTIPVPPLDKWQNKYAIERVKLRCLPNPYPAKSVGRTKMLNEMTATTDTIVATLILGLQLAHNGSYSEADCSDSWCNQ